MAARAARLCVAGWHGWHPSISPFYSIACNSIECRAQVYSHSTSPPSGCDEGTAYRDRVSERPGARLYMMMIRPEDAMDRNVGNLSHYFGSDHDICRGVCFSGHLTEHKWRTGAGGESDDGVATLWNRKEILASSDDDPPNALPPQVASKGRAAGVPTPVCDGVARMLRETDAGASH
eukprot:COSAG01_NODE_2641_length_7322_cov_115.896456_5_plen_177_part_00